MALSEMELFIDARRLPKGQEVTETTATPEAKPLYSAKEITKMMLTVPSNLTPEQSVETPVGRWHMDNGIAVFDPKPAGELDRITSRTKTEVLKGRLKRFLALT